MIKGAIFDIDGTLIDSMEMWEHAAERYLAGMGIEAEPHLQKKLYTFTITESAEYLKKNYGLSKTIPEIIDGINETIGAFYRNEAEPKPGIIEFLSALEERQIPMTVATATDRVHIEAVLKHNHMDYFFQKILTCSEVGIGKEHPDIYIQAAECMQTDIADTWVFEDAYHGAKTAFDAGFKVCGIYDLTSAEHVNELKKYSTIYVDDTKKLKEVFFHPLNTVLTIAGSDSSGGAGIQADIKTIMANGCYAMSAITALTAQNTMGVTGIQETTPEMLALQLDAVFTDIRPDAVKIGMVASEKLIRVIADKLKEYQADHVVVDTVMVSTSGHRLIDEDAIGALKECLLPIAEVITPNIPEAEVLAGMSIHDEDDMVRAAEMISKSYGCAVLCKGGHNINDANDVLYADGKVNWYYGKRIDNPNTHGTGCTLSSAIASNLAKGYKIDEAIKNAKDYISGALADGMDLGHGSGPMNHGFDLKSRFTES